MMYEVKQNPDTGNWHVERIGDDGEVYVAVFSGSKAEGLARDYARIKNGKAA